jgi:hypothetical protein
MEGLQEEDSVVKGKEKKKKERKFNLKQNDSSS